MKIFTNNAVYVQKNDIAYLNTTNLEIPVSIYTKLFQNGLIMINDKNRYEFVKYDRDIEINFFKNIDWIIDYNNIKNLNENELNELGDRLLEEKNNLIDESRKMNEKDMDRLEDLDIKCELLDYKMYMLRDFILLKKGKLKYEFPEGIEYPEIIKENGIKRLFKGLKKL